MAWPKPSNISSGIRRGILVDTIRGDRNLAYMRGLKPTRPRQRLVDPGLTGSASAAPMLLFTMPWTAGRLDGRRGVELRNQIPSNAGRGATAGSDRHL